MTEQSKVVSFPAQKRKFPAGAKSDQDHVAAIKKAQRALCRAIDEATAAGLNVRLIVDSTDTYSGSAGGQTVRQRNPEISRSY